MSIRDSIHRFFSHLIGKKEDYPVHETCAACGERAYLPFHCEYCGKYYCDRHRLPFDHDCRNIGQWKKRGK
ncbi:AN1-type zinc finger domain-containing protein [Methanoregula formicica]|nr:AN1-type zinc finger protein [Methanoregula formicica]